MAELYALTFANGKRYVGISNISAKHRYSGHEKEAKSGKRNTPVYQAWRKYGAPELKVIAIGSLQYIKESEIRAIDVWRLTDRRFGYNLSYGGDIDPKLNPEVMSRFRDKMKSIHGSEEYRRKVYSICRQHCIELNKRKHIKDASVERMRIFNSNPEFLKRNAKLSSERMKTNRNKEVMLSCRLIGQAILWANNREIPFTSLTKFSFRWINHTKFHRKLRRKDSK